MGPAIAVKLLASDLLHLLLPILVPGFITWLFNTAVRSGVTGEVAAVPASAPSLSVPVVRAGSVFLRSNTLLLMLLHCWGLLSE